MFDLNLAHLPKTRQARVSWLLFLLSISSLALPAFSQQVKTFLISSKMGHRNEDKSEFLMSYAINSLDILLRAEVSIDAKVS